MHIENFKCFKNFDIELGPFNVLIGPNDSGKTAFLQAIQLALAVPNGIDPVPFNLFHPLPEGLISETNNEDDFQKTNNWFWQGETENKIQIDIMAEAMDAENDSRIYSAMIKKGTGRSEEKIVEKDNTSTPSKDWRSYAIGRTDYLRLVPVSLRKPTRPSAEHLIRGEGSFNGEGLPSLVEKIRGDVERFTLFQKEFHSRFPYYKRIERKFINQGGTDLVKIEFVTRYDNVVPAVGVSDGVMLSLAFLALKYIPQPPCYHIFLIEEPENGVHPGALKEIRDTLWHLSRQEGIQVILTTHSPYLLDLVEPEEVRVFAKNQEGAVYAKNLAEFPDVERMRKHFMTGEIWTEFDENEIVFGKEFGKGAKK